MHRSSIKSSRLPRRLPRSSRSRAKRREEKSLNHRRSIDHIPVAAPAVELKAENENSPLRFSHFERNGTFAFLLRPLHRQPSLTYSSSIRQVSTRVLRVYLRALPRERGGGAYLASSTQHTRAEHRQSYTEKEQWPATNKPSEKLSRTSDASRLNVRRICTSNERLHDRACANALAETTRGGRTTQNPKSKKNTKKCFCRRTSRPSTRTHAALRRTGTMRTQYSEKRNVLLTQRCSYNNVLPTESTRVRLTKESDSDSDDDDYINANYINRNSTDIEVS
jgi:hypothetical protein